MSCLAKLHDMYLYKTDNFNHINHYLKSVSKVALLHRFYCTFLVSKILLVDSEGHDQTVQTHRLNWASLSAYDQRHIFAWRGPYYANPNSMFVSICMMVRSILKSRAIK